MIRLEDTSGGAIATAIAAERRRIGVGSTGMVLTLLIVTDESTQADATQAAVRAARAHPMRIVTLVPRPDSRETRLDAEILVGGEDGPGEVAVLRLRGALAEHANSVAIPLLLPDTPIVAFWPAACPQRPADDPLGRHAQRRITDAAAAPDPLGRLQAARDHYIPGDTDLAWARLTPWRSILASILDEPTPAITAGVVCAEEGNPSAQLLAVWLADCLSVPVDLSWGAGPGITRVALTTQDGDIAIDRPDAGPATLHRPGAPDALVSLPRRDLASLLAEELRRLDPDDIYARTLSHLP